MEGTETRTQLYREKIIYEFGEVMVSVHGEDGEVMVEMA